MDELESRLNDSLSRQAAGLPHFDGDLPKVKRRGRNRRWAARGVGAVGALVLLGGGVAIYAATRDEGGITIETGDDGMAVAGEVPTEIPVPTATPAGEPDDSVEGEPMATPDPDLGVRDVSWLVATGWGAGLVGPTGDLYVSLVCCEDNGYSWPDQDPATPARGALAVRDDLRGGLVASSVDSVYWLTAAQLEDNAEPLLLDSVATDEGSVSVDLWDLVEIDDSVKVLYSVSSVSDDGGSGWSELRSQMLDQGSEAQVLDSVRWAEADDDAFVWTGAAWLSEGGHMSLKSAHRVACEWIDFGGPGGGAPDILYSSPRPAPAKGSADCPNDSIAAATVNSDGTVAAIERYLSPLPQLVVYDRAGNTLRTYPLPDAAEGQTRWTELDMVGSHVFVSRDNTPAVFADPTLDETLRIDIESEADPRPVRYWGTPSFARSDISTDTLTPLSPESPLWFSLDSVALAPEPEPTPDPEAEPTPEPSPPAAETTPEPSPEPTEVPPTQIAPEARMATGRNVDVKETGNLIGDDGCLDGICLGMPIEDALDAAASSYGDEDTGTAAAESEGEPPPDNEHVFITDDARLTIAEAEGVVAWFRTFPTDASSGDDITTIGQVLATLGAPAEIFNGGGEGIQVLWLGYDTEAGFISYGFTEFWGGERSLLDEGDLELPAAYDDLPVNSYWAEPRG